MEANILLSKIVANPTETTWSQAYSTLNLYIVLSIRSPDREESIVTSGKELLERVQREYFSLDNKDLKNIKKSVENAVGELLKEREISLVLATVNEDILYIVIANGGSVILKRNGKIGTVASGEDGIVTSFSGRLTGDDIVILATQDFLKKVSTKRLAEILDALSVSEISENLAPLIHEEPQGTEAAIVLQYKSVADVTAGGQTKEADQQEAPSVSLIDRMKIPKVTLNINFSALGRKKMTAIAIAILVVLFVGSTLFERGRQESAKRSQALLKILTPAQNKFEEAEALVSLNRGLAREEFESIKGTLEKTRDKFPEGTAELKKLDEFIGKVEGKIGELGAGSTISNQKVIYENVAFVMFRKESLVASDKNGKISLLSSGGKLEKTIDSKNHGVKALAASDAAIYVLGDEGITRSIKSSGSTAVMIDDPDETISLDVFGANLYGLNAAEKTVDKYTGSSFTKSDYFVEDIKLNDPINMSIDGSIWILDGRKIRKFTRGKEDNFSLSGVPGQISSNSQIFTDIDYSHIYILDKNAAKIVSISKDGEFENQYSSPNLSDATSFAVDEPGKKTYVTIDNKLYSFDL